jgi:hypothetical protein
VVHREEGDDATQQSQQGEQAEKGRKEGYEPVHVGGKPRGGEEKGVEGTPQGKPKNPADARQQ